MQGPFINSLPQLFVAHYIRPLNFRFQTEANVGTIQAMTNMELS